jgi:hypothetical protein
MTFSDSLKLGTTPASLGPDAVIGCIKWDKKLGVPNGDLADAFSVLCISYQRVVDNVSGETTVSKFPRTATKTVGAEDSTHFRVLFFTNSFGNKGFQDGESQHDEKFRFINTVLVQVKPGTVWPNNAFAGPGHKVVEPDILNIKR